MENNKDIIEKLINLIHKTLTLKTKAYVKYNQPFEGKTIKREVIFIIKKISLWKTVNDYSCKYEGVVYLKIKEPIDDLRDDMDDVTENNIRELFVEYFQEKIEEVFPFICLEYEFD